MERLVAVMKDFLLDGRRQVVRFVHRHLVAGPPRKGTPKDTGFASGWQAGVGGPPPIEPGQPQFPRYPLRGDAEIDADIRDAELGDRIVMISPAEYIGPLAAGSSPQQPEADWIPDAFEAARKDLPGWTFEGGAA